MTYNQDDLGQTITGETCSLAQLTMPSRILRKSPSSTLWRLSGLLGSQGHRVAELFQAMDMMPLDTGPIQLVKVIHS